MNIDKTIKDRKIELLSYFRDRASESLTAIKVKFAETQSDKIARAINEKTSERFTDQLWRNEPKF